MLEIRGDLDSLLDDIPPAVIDGLRNWHKLPENIRRAVEALLGEGEDLTESKPTKGSHARQKRR